MEKKSNNSSPSSCVFSRFGDLLMEVSQLNDVTVERWWWCSESVNWLSMSIMSKMQNKLKFQTNFFHATVRNNLNSFLPPPNSFNKFHQSPEKFMTPKFKLFIVDNCKFFMVHCSSKLNLDTTKLFARLSIPLVNIKSFQFMWHFSSFFSFSAT